jgi:glycosyltransferase involved in cell wall biosynthesis
MVSEKGENSILKNFNIPGEKIWKIHTGVDIDRFDPKKIERDFRHKFGIMPENIVVGIVARIQKHRRFDIILQAASLAIGKIPQIKFLLIGRGTHMDELAVEPAKSMGLTNNIIFTGYRMDDYVETLSCMDIKVFLVPGSDGSCRAVKEAMAMGKPVIAARRGMLPEIVEDGKEGLVIDDTPLNLAEAILKLAINKNMREDMGKAARIKAQKAYSLDSQVVKIEKVYREYLQKTF